MAENENEYYMQVGETRLDTPLHPATQGNDGVEINKMLATTGKVTLDYGFGNTANCESNITYIDGGNGILRYRGYPIEELARESTFIEVCYLLIYGELPDAPSLERFTHVIKRNRLLPEDFIAFFGAFPSNGHPMSVLQAGVAGLATYYEDTLNPLDPDQLDAATFQLLGKLPTMVSMIAKRAEGLPTLYPDSSRDLTEDFIRMTFGLPYQSYDIDPAMVRALDTLFILHADHEQNCSTSTVRFVGSSHANLYASVASAIGALSGPLHGGANEAVLRMLIQMRDTDMTVKQFVEKVKNKEEGIKLMGFGHRVYKSYDPRAAIVKESAHEVLSRLGKADKLLDLATELEEVALSDDYFISRNLYPNVDFYTGLIYRAMGFRMKMFTPLFAIGRLPGWIAQYREMIKDPATKIARPRQVYIGETERHYTSLRSRGRLVKKD
ncbi:MAG: citrate synthase [Mobiluncus porci]|uniref:Citrate synthase n=1 Tax=Mobiluncus porci TaxID=2652278 RepID=A0A7K0K0I0_9ACTO|nr:MULTISPECIES: citrate synthase [Mobiluncus]MCI6585014.1 citrate synthase [Mobiluncus sp.]MDD7542154.1 citrate synthase [Mobiluncus porci]MDY5749013.1 citrate synthase [Mobiluncus porci]MST48944.1 citrate synthase [Mobiluncus porci]